MPDGDGRIRRGGGTVAGTVITLASNITSNGTLTYHVPAFIGKSVSGTWTLEVDGLGGGTLNSWSLSVFG